MLRPQRPGGHEQPNRAFRLHVHLLLRTGNVPSRNQEQLGNKMANVHLPRRKAERVCAASNSHTIPPRASSWGFSAHNLACPRFKLSTASTETRSGVSGTTPDAGKTPGSGPGYHDSAASRRKAVDARPAISYIPRCFQQLSTERSIP